jgi:hypothetical protein
MQNYIFCTEGSKEFVPFKKMQNYIFCTEGSKEFVPFKKCKITYFLFLL